MIKRYRFALLASLVLASTTSTFAQQPEDAPPPLQETKPLLEIEGAKQSAERKFGVITLGTTRAKVHELLGRPTFESTIPSLRRTVDQYKDGTEVTFVERKTISVRPSGKATRDKSGTHFVKGENATVSISPKVLRECGKIFADKCEIEKSFWFAAPTYAPSIYNGVPFTPPMINSPFQFRSRYGCECQQCLETEYFVPAAPPAENSYRITDK